MKGRGLAAGAAGSKSTRDLILDAAEQRFAERGFTGVSVREIAADVGLKNQASLYHHFRNKRALYEAVLARGVEAIVDLVASAPPTVGDGGASAQVDVTLDRVIDYLVEHPQLPRLIQRAGIDDIRHLRGAVTRLLRPLYQQGLGILALSGAHWSAEDLPHLGAGLYHIMFSYFANAQLLELVTQSDMLSADAVARQRRFVKSAVAELIGLRPPQVRGQVTPLRGVRRSAATKLS
ncbi:MAG TPA: helix-turn-helix domain-containing protein [Candidatus Acidoferrales bacterium]|nr:helix-turn-helix domain-containing protein [Candidatus Acidoferrales bacterium]